MLLGAGFRILLRLCHDFAINLYSLRLQLDSLALWSSSPWAPLTRIALKRFDIGN